MRPEYFWLTVGVVCYGLCGYTFIVTGMVAEEYQMPFVYQVGETVGLLLLIEAALCVLTPMSSTVAYLHISLLRRVLFVK